MRASHVRFPDGGRSPLALVGEAPSFKEQLAREPFVGPAGRVLESALRSAGMSRHGVLLTNVFENPLPGGAASAPLPIGPARERLAREIEQAGARGAVALGATAAGAMMAKAPRQMKRTRGVPAEPHEVLRAAGLEWVLPTYHPASCLGSGGGGGGRQGAPANRFLLAADLARAAMVVEHGVVVRETRIDVLAEVEDWHAWVAGVSVCEPDAVVAVDIETHRGQIDTIGVGTAMSALVVPILDPTGEWGPVWPRRKWQRIRAAVVEWLEGPTPKVFQNGHYDVWWLAEKWGVVVGGWMWDTRILHHVLEPELPKDLGTLGSLYAPGIGRAWKERH